MSKETAGNLRKRETGWDLRRCLSGAVLGGLLCIGLWIVALHVLFDSAPDHVGKFQAERIADPEKPRDDAFIQSDIHLPALPVFAFCHKRHDAEGYHASEEKSLPYAMPLDLCSIVLHNPSTECGPSSVGIACQSAALLPIGQERFQMVSFPTVDEAIQSLSGGVMERRSKATTELRVWLASDDVTCRPVGFLITHADNINRPVAFTARGHAGDAEKVALRIADDPDCMDSDDGPFPPGVLLEDLRYCGEPDSEEAVPAFVYGLLCVPIVFPKADPIQPRPYCRFLLNAMFAGVPKVMGHKSLIAVAGRLFTVKPADASIIVDGDRFASRVNYDTSEIEIDRDAEEDAPFVLAHCVHKIISKIGDGKKPRIYGAPVERGQRGLLISFNGATKADPPSPRSVSTPASKGNRTKERGASRRV